MPSETMLEKIKKALLIPTSETYADDELTLHIASCRQLLITSGVPSEIAGADTDPLVQGLILIYVKTYFGFKNDGSVKELPSGFETLLRQLCLVQASEEV